MFQYLLLAIVIICLISLIYWLFFNKDSRHRKRAKDDLKQSIGTFDTYARRALTELSQIADPAPDDQFRRANIIRYNVMGGRVDNRQNRTYLNRVATDYTNVLLGIHTEQRPEFMLDHIGGFYGDLLAFDDADINFQNILLGLGRAYNTNAPVAREAAINSRKQEAAQEATPADAIDRYFDLATSHTDDPQNVHDPKVNADLRVILNKLRDSAVTPIELDVVFSEITDYIDTKYTRSKRADATTTLLKMSQGDQIMTFNTSEDKILAYTWTRTEHPRNRANENDLKTAVCDALADSVENGAQVCINGRCGRVLNSLALLDFDPSMTGAMTYEAYRNKIFQEAKYIFEREITAAAESSDPALRAIGESFDDSAVEQNVEILKAFKDNIKAEIDANVEQYPQLSESEKNMIKQECYIATDF